MTSNDPLLLFRNAVVTGHAPSLTTTSDPTSAPSNLTESYLEATDVYFPSPTPQCIPFNTPTRFWTSDSDPSTPSVQLTIGSVFSVYQFQHVNVGEVLTKIAELNTQLPADKQLQRVAFLERVDLTAWLEGGGSSEFIRPLEGADAAHADATSQAVGGVTTAGGPATSGIGAVAGVPGTGKHTKTIDPRLQEIYNGERRMGDHNTVLRGIKPTDFSHVRKHAAAFLDKRRQSQMAASRPGQQQANKSYADLPNRTAPTPRKALTPSTVSSKRSDPIILLSPSASSLLRISNIRSFLDTGTFVPPDHPTLSSQATANLLHITRTLKSLSDRPYRFILVDSPEQFKPDYWSRVVAVFTTGQTWQFRSYKWREPQELFGHVLGIYVGEKGAPIPPSVKGWGSSVKYFELDRWDERTHGTNVDAEVRKSRRWRDQETVEEVWRSLEGFMRGKGEWRR